MSDSSTDHTTCNCSPNPPIPADLQQQQQQQATQPSAAAPSSPPQAHPTSNEDDEDEDEDDDGASEISAKWAALLRPDADSKPETLTSIPFDYQRHVQYFAYHLKSIPQGYESLDTSRMTLLYFCLSALDVLGAIEATVFNKGNAPKIIEWIYAAQVHPVIDPATRLPNYERCGFRGGTSLGLPFEPNRTEGHDPTKQRFDEAHIAMTYTALCCLRILGDDFSRVNKKAVIGALRSLQQPDGSFSSTAQRSESDMRFLYCACSISAMLGDWTGFDTEKSIQFVRASQSYDGGIGLWPGCEGHGGSTYTAVASLVLMNAFHRLGDTKALLKWCISNQGAGFRGRPNKPPDSCYSFWIGASLMMMSKELNQPELWDWTKKAQNRVFNLTCQQDKSGGFSKVPGNYHPDLLHSYFGVCGLSLQGFDQQLRNIDCMLGLTQRCVGNTNQKKDGSW